MNQLTDEQYALLRDAFNRLLDYYLHETLNDTGFLRKFLNRGEPVPLVTHRPGNSQPMRQWCAINAPMPLISLVAVNAEIREKHMQDPAKPVIAHNDSPRQHIWPDQAPETIETPEDFDRVKRTRQFVHGVSHGDSWSDTTPEERGQQIVNNTLPTESDDDYSQD